MNYLYINNLDDQSKQTWGYHRDFSDGGEELYGRRNTFEQNNIHIFQLLGQHELNKKIHFNWGSSYSITRNLIPDRKQITALYHDREQTDQYTLLALDANHTHRFYSELSEKEYATHAELNWDVLERKQGDTLIHALTLLSGFDYKLKDRTFSFRQFNYIAKELADQYAGQFDVMNPDEIINDENHDLGLYRIEESANPGNGYTAGQSLLGANLGAKYNFKSKLEIVPNLRVEQGYQIVTNRKQTQATIKEVNIVEGLDLMPSFNVKYTIKDNRFFRLGGSRTIIRPKFFEVAPFEYLAQVVGMVQIGNPQLQNAQNLNLDFAL